MTIAVGASIDTPLKELVARARPVFTDPVATAPGYSFPSGTRSTRCSSAPAPSRSAGKPPEGRPWRRTALLAGATALVVATGFDRVGLGVHYTSDVVGGWFIGLSVVCATTAAFNLGVTPAERDAGEPACPSSPDPRSPA